MLRVLELYYEPQPSGQTTHVLSLVRGLNRQRYQVIVALPAHLEQPVGAFQRLGVRTIPLPLRSRSASVAISPFLR